MNGELVALILAVVLLVMVLVRKPRSGAPSRAVVCLLPVAMIIGLLPRILRLSEAMKITGSVTSLVLSVTAIGLFIIHPHRGRSSR